MFYIFRNSYLKIGQFDITILQRDLSDSHKVISRSVLADVYRSHAVTCMAHLYVYLITLWLYRETAV